MTLKQKYFLHVNSFNIIFLSKVRLTPQMFSPENKLDIYENIFRKWEIK